MWPSGSLSRRRSISSSVVEDVSKELCCVFLARMSAALVTSAPKKFPVSATVSVVSVSVSVGLRQFGISASGPGTAVGPRSSRSLWLANP